MMRVVPDPPLGGEGRLEVEYMAKAGTTRVGTAELVVESHPLLFCPDEEVLQIWREAAEEHVDAGSGLVVVVLVARTGASSLC